MDSNAVVFGVVAAVTSTFVTYRATPARALVDEGKSEDPAPQGLSVCVHAVLHKTDPLSHALA